MNMGMRLLAPALTGTQDSQGLARSVMMWDRAPCRVREGDIAFSLTALGPRRPWGNSPAKGTEQSPGLKGLAQQGWRRESGKDVDKCALRLKTPGAQAATCLGKVVPTTPSASPGSFTQKMQPSVPERLLKADLCLCAQVCLSPWWNERAAKKHKIQNTLLSEG